MSAELAAALAGAFAGALITGAISFAQQKWSYDRELRARAREEQVRLTRELMRYRLDQKALIGPLNEIPLMFGHNLEALRLYRVMLDADSSETRTRALSDLINLLAADTGLPAVVRPSDVERGFRLQP